MPFSPCCLATGIGSLPNTDLDQAMALVESTMSEIPYMPQLPALSWHEGMMVQYTEGLPGRVLDEVHEKITSGVADAGGIKEVLFNWALGVGYRVSALKQRRKPTPFLLGLRHALANKLVLSKIQDAFGGQLVEVGSTSCLQLRFARFGMG